MVFKQILAEKLRNKLTAKQLELLPTGYQGIGDIIILNLKQELTKHSNKIGQAVLEILPRFRTACIKQGGITGKFRKPQIKVIAGDKNTESTHIENKCKYKFDITKIMFAKGNVTERARLPKQIKQGEIIVDMFAGIGYFTIPIAVLSKPKKIYSIELNPISFKYLKENLKLNKIENKVEAINGDATEEVKKLKDNGITADRVIMGLLPAPKEHLPAAISIIKKKGILHYEGIASENKYQRILDDVKQAAEKAGRKSKLIKANKVKSYGPKIYHYTLDIKVY